MGKLFKFLVVSNLWLLKIILHMQKLSLLLKLVFLQEMVEYHKKITIH
jgi:hypothetical protein